MSLRTSSRIGLAFSLRLSILYAFLFIISSIALFILAYYSFHYLIMQEEKKIIQARIDEYSAWHKEGGVSAVKARFSEQSRQDEGLFFARIAGDNQEIRLLNKPEGFKAFDESILDGIDPSRLQSWLSIKGKSGEDMWTIASTRLSDGLVLQIGKSSAQSLIFLRYFRNIFFYIFIPLVLLAILGSGVHTFRTIKPIRNLIQTVQDILKTGKMSERVPARSGTGELDRLVTLFNQMLEKNELLVNAVYHALDNVAHDLRTPMTRLRGITEFALRDPNNMHGCRAALANCMEETERILTILNTLMDVAEAETGAMRLRTETVSVSDLIASVIELYELVADEKNITITAELPHNLKIKADRTRLQQAIANLIDNAIKYSADDSTITVTAHEETATAHISVADDGPGIPPHEIDRIWDRLYRGDQSRSQRGLGLGLNFVQAIVKAHGGSIVVASEVQKGSIFTITLPAVQK
jgi:signal transduction histidine kinase